MIIFFNTSQKKEAVHRISLCGKLEAIIGNYFLSGAGNPDNNIQILYYDSKVDYLDTVPLLKENIVAYIFENENVAFVREDMLTKVEEDTEEYELVCVPVTTFEADEFYLEADAKIPILFENIIWIDDDFMSNENIEFDFDSFEIIDSGKTYINPKHFSVMDLVNTLQR